MNIKDRVYNEISIKNHIILEFIHTSPFQRLKKINQYGGVNFVYPNYQVTRYEHSLGVWHILKTLGASLEVQIAGLLHDIGHTAFSHMVDHALENKNENFHEKHFRRIKDWNEIEKLLKKYKITLKKVDEYPEIKKKMPYVGADRLDYAVRDYIGSTGKRAGFGAKLLKKVSLVNNSIVFTSKTIAKEYALMGLRSMWLVIYDPKVAVIYQAVTEMLRQGIKEKWLSIDDLFTEDYSVMKIFLKNKHKLDSKYINVFKKSFHVTQGTPHNYDFLHLKHRIRYFDPALIIKNKKVGLSSLDADFSDKLTKMVSKFEKAQTGNYLKVQFSTM